MNFAFGQFSDKREFETQREVVEIRKCIAIALSGALIWLACGGGGNPSILPPKQEVKQEVKQPGELRRAESVRTVSPAQAGNWTIEIVEPLSPGGMSWNTSIAVDPSAGEHLAYYDALKKDLKYATKIGGVWTPTILDAQFDVGRFNSIGLTPTPVFSAYRSGGALNFYSPARTTVDAMGDAGSFNDLAVGNGTVHISYVSTVGNRLNRISQLKYARNDGSGWTTEVIQWGPANSTSSIAYTSIAVSSDGTVHISYRGLNNELRYAWGTSGSWNHEAVPGVFGIGATSILLDGDGIPHIIYYIPGASGGLYHAWKTAGLWQTELIAPRTIIGSPSSALWHPTAEQIFIAAYDFYAQRDLMVFESGNSWISERVEVAEDTGKYASIDVGPDGCLHIVFFNQTARQLKVARQETECPGPGIPPPPPPQVGKPFSLLGGQSDEDLVNIFNSSVILTSPPDSDFVPVPGANTGVILVGDFVMIGVNPLGNLDTPATFENPMILGWDAGGNPSPVPLPPMDPDYPNGSAGFAFRADPSLPFEEDVMSPGCLCEGWGVVFNANSILWQGSAAVDGSAFNNATSVFFGTTYDPAQGAWFVRSIVSVGPMEILMDWSLRKADKYSAERILLRNTSTTETITDVRFVRSLDYDVGPGHFSDVFKFLYPIGVPQLIRSRDSTSIDPYWDGPPDPNDNFYGVATVSPFTTCANGITFMLTDPDYILTADENGDNIPDCNQDPNNNPPADYSSSFVFEVSSIPPGGTTEL